MIEFVLLLEKILTKLHKLNLEVDNSPLKVNTEKRTGNHMTQSSLLWLYRSISKGCPKRTFSRSEALKMVAGDRIECMECMECMEEIQQKEISDVSSFYTRFPRA